MSTISTFGQNNSLIQHMLANQRKVFDQQTIVSTGKKAEDFKGYAAESAPLLASRTELAQTDALIKSNEELAQQLEIYNLSLGGLAQIAEEIRQELIQTVNLSDSVGFMDSIRSLFDRAVSLLNTQVNEKQIFAGTRFDAAPVAADTEAALLALAAPADAFVNNATKSRVRIEDTQTLQYGVLADEVATDLFNAFYRIMQWNAGTLPAGAVGTPSAFTGTLNPDQKNFLIAELPVATTAITTARSFEAANGVRMQNLDKIIVRQEDETVFEQKFIAGIEGISLEEAIIKLNEDRTALEASMQVVARMSQLNLLNFI